MFHSQGINYIFNQKDIHIYKSAEKMGLQGTISVHRYANTLNMQLYLYSLTNPVFIHSLYNILPPCFPVYSVWCNCFLIGVVHHKKKIFGLQIWVRFIDQTRIAVVLLLRQTIRKSLRWSQVIGLVNFLSRSVSDQI